MYYYSYVATLILARATQCSDGWGLQFCDRGYDDVPHYSCFVQHLLPIIISKMKSSVCT